MDSAELDELIAFYHLAPGDGDALRGALLAEQGHEIVLVNLLQLRERAEYEDGTSCSGAEAMLRYSAVSGERLAAVGGDFLYQGLSTGQLWGSGQAAWNIVVVGRYPNGDAVLELLRDPRYRDAYRHRKAAVADQCVLASTPLG